MTFLSLATQNIYETRNILNLATQNIYGTRFQRIFLQHFKEYFYNYIQIETKETNKIQSIAHSELIVMTY